MSGAQDQATGFGVSYVYDSDGNLTGRSSTAGDMEGFGFDAANRMTSYSYWDFSGGTGSATYAYDDSGARASRVATKSLPAQTAITANTITVDDDYEIDLARGKARRHVFIDGQRALTLETPSLAATPVQEFQIHRDHLGTSRLITNETGAVVQRAFNDPFGAMYKVVDGAGNDLAPSNRVSQYLFTGHHADIETGLDYFAARYYDPLVGRFLSQDPHLVERAAGTSGHAAWTSTQGLDAYAYVDNRPTRLVDPTGKDGWDTAWLCVYCMNPHPDLGVFMQQQRWEGAAGLAIAGISAAPFGVDALYGVGIWALGNPEKAIGLAEAAADLVLNPGAPSPFRPGLASTSGAGEAGVARVLHFTDDVGREMISKSESLRAGTFVTLPGEIPAGSTAREVEQLLEIAPGRGRNFIDAFVNVDDLVVPGPEHGGAFTSGGVMQLQLQRELSIDPTRFGTTEW